ncbi:MAG: hypothetical protein U9Q98_01050 [Bacteroidota bacterium]|nr:hypothetical protein [Bacteroidota bacterium]
MNTKLGFLLLGGVLMLFSCKDDKQETNSDVESKRIARLKAENQKLQEVAEKKDESLKQFMQAFNDINKNLQIIKQKEDIISMSASESPQGISSEQIQDDILLIYRLLRENKKTINELRANLEKADMISVEMQKSLDMLAKTVEKKDKEIQKYRIRLESRNSELAKVYKQMDSLIADNEEKTRMIKNQKEFLNTAYMVIGTASELYKKGVTSKTGGIIGLGTVTKFDDNFERDVFESIKIKEHHEIPLHCKHAVLLSTHPSTSYKFSGPPGRIDKLLITRPEKFWSTSRYLVIEISP